MQKDKPVALDGINVTVLKAEQTYKLEQDIADMLVKRNHAIYVLHPPKQKEVEGKAQDAAPENKAQTVKDYENKSKGKKGK